MHFHNQTFFYRYILDPHSRGLGCCCKVLLIGHECSRRGDGWRMDYPDAQSKEQALSFLVLGILFYLFEQTLQELSDDVFSIQWLDFMRKELGL